MKKEVIFIILDQYSDWESAFVSTALNVGVMPGSPVPYTVKTMSVTKDPVRTIGGFTTIPDYGLTDVPADYAALVLVGGMSWNTPDAAKLVPFVADALSRNIPVAAICNATAFLGANGFLNDVKHTSNMLEVLKEWGAGNYTGEDNYINEQAVSDGGIVTANGTGYLEFCREVLLLLSADTPENIEMSYMYNKLGHCELVKRGWSASDIKA